jgi:hypothetical protein
MASTSQTFPDSSSTHIVHRGEASAGPFMLTLCRLVEPVSIRPPQSAHLRPFTFFTSRARQADGSEQLRLHMGFFESLADADRLARAVRGRHPDAIATIAPTALWLLPDSDRSEQRSIEPREGSAGSQHAAPVDATLTDTQVLNMLELRQPAPARSDVDEQAREQIELLRPDDTGTRRALKEAVVRGAPVSFAVQLHWSARPIDPSGVPPLALLKAHTLYSVESRRANRSCFFLRLGFFADPVSAKEVALRVRSTFASAAVVPVLDEEIARAREGCMDTFIPCLVRQRLDEVALESSTTSGWAAASTAENGRRRRTAQDPETLEQTLAQLAERELWSDSDFLSDTGVRHLKVEVEQRTSPARGARAGSRH